MRSFKCPVPLNGRVALPRSYADCRIQVGTQELDPSKSPKTIDMTLTEGPNKGAIMLGIYEIDADTLKACFDPQGKTRPTEFKSTPGSANFLNIHKRMKK